MIFGTGYGAAIIAASGGGTPSTGILVGSQEFSVTDGSTTITVPSTFATATQISVVENGVELSSASFTYSYPTLTKASGFLGAYTGDTLGNGYVIVKGYK